MQKKYKSEQRNKGRRPNFKRRNRRHSGFAERDTPPPPAKPTGELPPGFADTVFGTLNPMLQHALHEEGYQTPTPIQEQAIPLLLLERDLLGCAQTGTGKTAAFVLPILHKLMATPQPPQPNKPRALILAPTRELAAQIAASVATYGRYSNTTFAVVFGGVSQFPQVKALNRGATLVVATPGRLLDLMEQGHISLGNIEEFVLDEADRMLDMGFLPDIRRVISKLPQKRHTQFFSATLAPEVLKLAYDLVREPAQITISPQQPTVEKINQQLLFVDKENKDALLLHLLSDRPEYERVIVFVRTRYGADKIVRKLRKADISALAIHSDKSQRARTDTLESFRKGRTRVLVATDIASRGIDVEGITHVVNFNLPEESESYVHRIGRTARAGANGAAISFVSAEERGLLRAIQRLIKMEIAVDRLEEFHSENAEAAFNKSNRAQLPRPPWAGRKKRSGPPPKSRNKRPPRRRDSKRSQW